MSKQVIPSGIEIGTETLISIAEAARLLPSSRQGRPVSVSCVLRWILQGVKIPGGSKVHLEAIRMGGRWITSKEALQRFADRQTPAIGDVPSVPTPTARLKASERAARELEKYGI